MSDSYCLRNESALEIQQELTSSNVQEPITNLDVNDVKVKSNVDTKEQSGDKVEIEADDKSNKNFIETTIADWKKYTEKEIQEHELYEEAMEMSDDELVKLGKDIFAGLEKYSWLRDLKLACMSRKIGKFAALRWLRRQGHSGDQSQDDIDNLECRLKVIKEVLRLDKRHDLVCEIDQADPISLAELYLKPVSSSEEECKEDPSSSSSTAPLATSSTADLEPFLN